MYIVYFFNLDMVPLVVIRGLFWITDFELDTETAKDAFMMSLEMESSQLAPIINGYTMVTLARFKYSTPYAFWKPSALHIHRWFQEIHSYTVCLLATAYLTTCLRYKHANLPVRILEIGAFIRGTCIRDKKQTKGGGLPLTGQVLG